MAATIKVDFSRFTHLFHLFNHTPAGKVGNKADDLDINGFLCHFGKRACAVSNFQLVMYSLRAKGLLAQDENIYFFTAWIWWFSN